MSLLNIENKSFKLDNNIFSVIENDKETFRADVSWDDSNPFSELYGNREEFLRKFIFSHPKEYNFTQCDIDTAVNFILEN